MNDDEKRSALVQELYDFFVTQGFRILGVKGLPGFRRPQPFHNDGYGDQRDKTPDIVAYDDREGTTVIGIVRLNVHEIDTEGSQTEYNVFLDQNDPKTGKPALLYINMPHSLTTEFTLFIHHYIHREYWYKLIVMASRLVP